MTDKATVELPQASSQGLGRSRIVAGSVLTVVGLTLLTLVLVAARDSLALASVVLLYLVAVVTIAVIGGIWPALATAVASDLLVNFFFVPPYHTLTVENRDHVITLVVYVAVAVTVSLAVDLAARQRAAAARSGIEAALLARITAEPVEAGSLQKLLEQIRDTFGMTSVALIETDGTTEPDGTTEHSVAHVGHETSATPVLSAPAGTGLRLVADGPPVFAADQRLFTRLAAAAGRTLQAERTAAEAAQARELAEVDRLRAALLAAVGHDLRTPLAGIKAAASSLRDPEITLTASQESELLATIEESTDRMDALVENLLAASRLQAGVLSAEPRPVALDEIVASTLLHTPGDTAIEIDIPDDLPLAYADPGLLERVIANLISNAERVNPPDQPIRIHAHTTGNQLELSIVDHGSGVSATDRERIFAPFQRLGDYTADGGLGLGLAIARGFTEAMGGTITPTDTPGGGLTMTVTFPGGAMTRILVVDDDRQLLRALHIALSARGYQIAAAHDGTSALAAATHTAPDLAIVDLGLPDMDGITIVESLRGWSTAPIIVLSARHIEQAKINALDAGADDYVTKPFSMGELLARVRAALRRATPADQQPVITTEAFTIDLAAKRVTTTIGEVRLTPTEWHLLEVLARNAGKLLTHKQLLHEVWGPQYETETNYLRVHMANLRRKLEPDPTRPRYLRTDPGVGYRFIP